MLPPSEYQANLAVAMTQVSLQTNGDSDLVLLWYFNIPSLQNQNKHLVRYKLLRVFMYKPSLYALI